MKADFVYEPRSRSAFDEARRIRVRNRISGKETGYFDGIFGEYIESGVTIQFTYSTIGRLSRYTNEKGIPDFHHIPVAYLILREEIAGQFSQLQLIGTIKSKKLESTLLEIIENIASGLRICVKGEYIQDISVEAEIDDFDIDEFQVIIYDTMPSESQMESIKKAFKHGRAEGIFSEDATFLEYVKTFDCKDPRKIPDPKYISEDYVYAPSTNRNGQFIFDGRCFAVNHERSIRISGSYGAGACISSKWGYYQGDGVQFVFPIWPLFETIIVETEDGRGRFVEGWPIALFVPITILEREYERAFYETNSIYLALPDFRVLRRDIIDGLTEFGTRGGVALAWLKSFRVVLLKRRPTPKEWLALQKHVRDERLRLKNAEKATIG